MAWPTKSAAKRSENVLVDFSGLSISGNRGNDKGDMSSSLPIGINNANASKGGDDGTTHALTAASVNKMKVGELRMALEKLGLSANGKKDTLCKRLKAHVKDPQPDGASGAASKNGTKIPRIKTASLTQGNGARHKNAKSATAPAARPKRSMREQPFKYYIVIDFEATCEENVRNYPHEIIEFPAVLVEASTKTIIDTFQRYCKPVKNPTLTDFCVELTGITQDKVDKAQCFEDVLEEFYDWVQKKHALGMEVSRTFACASDGPWDFRDFLRLQCNHSRIERPSIMTQWVDIRKYFQCYCKQSGNVQKMLAYYNMEFEGRQHCGLDDSKNIARIMISLMNDGCVFNLNGGNFDKRKHRV